MIDDIVYLLCAISSLMCAGFLLRGHVKSGSRLLLWCGLCFSGLFIANALLYIDLVLFPDFDLTPVRAATTLASVGLMLFGLIWEMG